MVRNRWGGLIIWVMEHFLVQDLQASVGFGESDAANIRALAPHIAPVLPEVIDNFYARLLASEGARSVFTGGEAQIAALRGVLSTWLEELLAGPYDATYYEKRRRIGSAHVRVGLPQHYMFTGMELIWQDLERKIRARGISGEDEKLRSVHKALMLDLAVMLESYKQSYSEQVRDFERSAVEEKLTRAEHLAEIGQLAASLAHEIKNPLAGISGAIQIIRDGMDAEHPHQPIVTEILGQIRRLDATVKDLLHYARPTQPRAVPVDLDAVIRRVLTILQEEPALHRVRMRYEGPRGAVTVLADEPQLEQLLLNLLLNAAHASRDGDAITLGVEQNARTVQLTVHDHGEGMVPDVRARAFEPFFTTKAKGTGLGLSICRRIVELHGGDIQLESEAGQGTTVRIVLPSGRPASRRGKPGPSERVDTAPVKARGSPAKETA